MKKKRQVPRQTMTEIGSFATLLTPFQQRDQLRLQINCCINYKTYLSLVLIDEGFKGKSLAPSLNYEIPL